jgi:hypothetical protein
MDNKLALTDDSVVKLMTHLIDSKKLPGHVKTIEDAITVAQMGKELGFGIMQSFHYIIPISGKLSLAAKAVGALLRRGGIKYNTIEDGVYILDDGTAVDTLLDGQKFKDRRTTIYFYRDGLEERCTFTWKDAAKQGLTTKDNWLRLPKEMLYARCLAKGANRIGADLLLGLYTTEEMVDVLNINESDIIRTEDGLIQEIKN